MPDSTARGYPYVIPADALTDYPAVSQELANDVDLLHARIEKHPERLAFVSANSQNEVDFQSIPQTFRHLLLVWRFRNASAVASARTYFQLNGDTTASYVWSSHYASGTAAPVAQGAFGVAQIDAGFHAGESAPAGCYGVGEILIPDYASAEAKTILLRSAYRRGSTASEILSHMGAATWGGGAINRVRLFPEVSYFLHARVALYGIA